MEDETIPAVSLLSLLPPTHKTQFCNWFYDLWCCDSTKYCITRVTLKCTGYSPLLSKNPAPLSMPSSDALAWWKRQPQGGQWWGDMRSGPDRRPATESSPERYGRTSDLSPTPPARHADPSESPGRRTTLRSRFAGGEGWRRMEEEARPGGGRMQSKRKWRGKEIGKTTYKRRRRAKGRKWDGNVGRKRGNKEDTQQEHCIPGFRFRGDQAADTVQLNRNTSQRIGRRSKERWRKKRRRNCTEKKIKCQRVTMKWEKYYL